MDGYKEAEKIDKQITDVYQRFLAQRSPDKNSEEWLEMRAFIRTIKTTCNIIEANLQGGD